MRRPQLHAGRIEDGDCCIVVLLSCCVVVCCVIEYCCSLLYGYMFVVCWADLSVKMVLIHVHVVAYTSCVYMYDTIMVPRVNYS